MTTTTTRVCMCIYVCPVGARACESERRSERERRWSHLGKGLPTPVTCRGWLPPGHHYIYIRSARTASTIACGLTFFGRIILYTLLYIFILLYARPRTQCSQRSASSADGGRPFFRRLSDNISHYYYRYIKRYVVRVIFSRKFSKSSRYRCGTVVLWLYTRALVFGHFNACPAEVDLV